ncbi:MAG TPA: PIN domain nuclease [Bacteroidales bacterium]|nr:MAG: twitching motility protein PilT [Bacteroidetes bacterium GWF2_33_38]OFY71497.1 MAG: twitching motility protein PilT [Bacteroidetes bacterium RIFOXYA12_FULL_33_9]OFY90760.1 MAG: twitching motility protein PilT [Bacteroidetes bacterium RIFOXYA2_FULL_33_7]HBF87722.1 PIN domain nuclease [Bacteroidales bacterium]
MKKLFIDTNIVIDLLAKREPFYEDAAKLFSLADKNKCKLYLSTLTFANINYILQKTNSVTSTREILRKFKILISILSIDDKIIDLALNDNKFIDFEDAIQYYSAIENNQDIIITRNLKDFTHSKLPVMTASEFIKTIK